MTRRRIPFTFSLPGQRIATEVARAEEKLFLGFFPAKINIRRFPPTLIYSVAECVRTTNENGQALTYFPDFPPPPPLQRKFRYPPRLTLVKSIENDTLDEI